MEAKLEIFYVYDVRISLCEMIEIALECFAGDDAYSH